MANNVTNQIQYVSSGDPETVDDTIDRYPGQLGSEITVKQPGQLNAPGATGEEYRDKRYKRIQVDSSASVSPFRGAVAWWAHEVKYLVTTNPATLGRNRVAGVFQNAIGLGHFGYILIGGPGTVKFLDAPTAVPSIAGQQVIPSATAGKADAIAAGTATGWTVIGKTAGTYDAANAECVCELDVPHGRP